MKLYISRTVPLSIVRSSFTVHSAMVSETCRVSCQNKFVKLVRLVIFIIKEKC